MAGLAEGRKKTSEAIAALSRSQSGGRATSPAGPKAGLIFDFQGPPPDPASVVGRMSPAPLDESDVRRSEAEMGRAERARRGAGPAGPGRAAIGELVVAENWSTSDVVVARERLRTDIVPGCVARTAGASSVRPLAHLIFTTTLPVARPFSR